MTLVCASLVAQTVKRLPAMRETWVRSLGREDPWRRKWQPTPASLPGESHEWRSLVGYSPQGHKESDTTGRLHSFIQFSGIAWKGISNLAKDLNLCPNIPAVKEERSYYLFPGICKPKDQTLNGRAVFPWMRKNSDERVLPPGKGTEVRCHSFICDPAVTLPASPCIGPFRDQDPLCWAVTTRQGVTCARLCAIVTKCSTQLKCPLLTVHLTQCDLLTLVDVRQPLKRILTVRYVVMRRKEALGQCQL